MDLEFINMQMAIFIKEIGKIINHMQKESLYGVMGINMKEIMKMV